MRPAPIDPDGAIRHGVVPWVDWEDTTVVGCVLFVYSHSPVPIVLAGKFSGGPAAGSGTWLGVGDHLMGDFRSPKKMQNHEK